MSIEIRRQHYLDQPFEVALETLAQCNAACSFCPYPTLERIGTKMPDDLIYRVIDEMATFTTYPFYFSPFKVSEPLLDKRLFTILKRYNERVPYGDCRIFTNGSALTWDMAEKLDNIDKLDMVISLNSHLKEVYEPLMGLKFERTIKNIDALHESTFRHHVKILKVGMDIPFQEFIIDRWPRFEPVCVKKDGWLGYTDPDIGEVPDTPCGRWFELSIMANGICSICCMSSDDKFAIGDINKNTLLEVYNAPLWRDRRERMISRKEIHPCSTCSY